MKRSYLILLIVFFLIVSGLIVLYFVKTFSNKDGQIPSSVTSTITQSPALTPSATPAPSDFATPVADFAPRITKKPFGIYITRQNSPIQPERFSGYHTGADAEYEDASEDVPVYAIADGNVVLSETASGYGGVFMISFDLNGSQHTALYGHIRPSSLPKVGTTFNMGDQLGLLGTGYSSETDVERRHLHFAILSDDRLDIKGYVQSKSELSGWIDPPTIF